MTNDKKPGVTKRTLIDAADYVIDEFARLELPLSKHNRFVQMRAALVDETGSPRVVEPHDRLDDRKFETAREAMRDVRIMAFIFDWLAIAPNMPAYGKLRIAKARQDATLPQDDRHGDSKGRDAQFELFVGAVCAKAQMLPRIEEPDIMIKHESTDYGFAAKRVKSYPAPMYPVRGWIGGPSEN